MGEVILHVRVRNRFLNVKTYKVMIIFLFLNFLKEYKQDGTITDGEVHDNRDIKMEEKFKLSIKVIHSDNGYSITFDCDEPYFREHTMRLPFTSVDHIFVSLKILNYFIFFR